MNTGLYEVNAKAIEFPHRGLIWPEVNLLFFANERPHNQPPVPYEVAIENYRHLRQEADRIDRLTFGTASISEGDRKTLQAVYLAEDYVRELFSLEEAQALARWLRVNFGDGMRDITIKKAPLLTVATIRDRQLLLPVGALPVGGRKDFHIFSDYEEWNLPFAAWAYYSVEGLMPIRRVEEHEAERKPQGKIIPGPWEGSGEPSPPQELLELGEALGQAIAAGEALEEALEKSGQPDSDVARAAWGTLQEIFRMVEQSGPAPDDDNEEETHE